MRELPGASRAPLGVLVVALGALAACASPPAGPTPPARPVAPTSGDAAPLDSVATAAPAPVASGAVPIDLATVLALAGEKPNAIRLARERLAQADARTDSAFAGLLPSLVLGNRFERHDGTIQDVSGKFFQTTRQHLFAGATGELVLDMGSGVLGYLRDRQRREAAEADLEAATQERAAAAASAYFALAGAEADVAIASESLEHARAFLDVAAARERNALGIALDTLRAQAEVARARQALLVAEEHAHVASIRLATLLRLDATVILHAAERTLRPITFIAPDTPAAQLVATALANHPEVRAADRRAGAADLEDDATHVGPLIPTLRAGVGGLNGGLGWDGAELGKARDREDYYVGLELHLDGLGFGEVARARASSARLREARVQADETRETVAELVLESREAVRARHAAIEVALEELEAADEARTIAEKRLEQGRGLAIDVLAAEEERTRAATHVVEAIVGYDSAQYELLARTGERAGP